MVYDSILEAIGNTPLVRLGRMSEPDAAEVLVKVEGLNVGGSIKTRTACHMITEAERRGLLGPDSIIAEPTSGNQGIGLALVGAVLGYQTVIVMPDSVSEERRLLVEQYGATVYLVADHGDIGDCIERCLEKVRQLAADNPKVYIPQQFTNEANPAIHRDETAREILEAVEGPLHGFCSGIGTGGTISGVGEVLRDRFPDILIWAIEPDQAAILSGGPIGTHLQMGIGDGLIPHNLNQDIYDEVVTVTDDEAIATARRLAREEGLLCGITGGSNVAAALRMARRLGPGKSVVTILPDTGERYFSTPLFERHGG
ncbi:MAG: cysteine synthase A [Clostridiales bacterium]|nr:cysteine synthase A [Clostridiales bacterium]